MRIRSTLALALAVAALLLASCRAGTPPDLAGRWRVSQIEWTQNDQQVRLTAEGEMHIGRLKLPQRPRSFEMMFEAMATVTVEVQQSGSDIRGALHASPEAPARLLQQVGATPASVVAEFAGDLVNDTLGSVVITTPDGQRRDILFLIENGGRRVVARAVPVFGESEARAGDVVLVPIH